MNSEKKDPSLHLPRLLCLHGGGVNAQVFRLQARALIMQLKSCFRLCFADGPFVCDPGPGMIPMYKDFGPFRRWLRWLPEHAELDARTTTDLINRHVMQAMEEDNACGATGEWVGVLGFSQGAKIAASLLFMQQKQTEQLGKGRAAFNFHFAVILAGRAPLVSLDPRLITSPLLADPGQSTMAFERFPDEHNCEDQDHILRLPTVHVHGQQDQGLHLHRRLLKQYCHEDSTRLVEWDGDHRVPVKTRDVAAVVKQIVEIGKQTGVL